MSHHAPAKSKLSLHSSSSLASDKRALRAISHLSQSIRPHSLSEFNLAFNTNPHSVAGSSSSSRGSSDLAGTININASFHHNCEVDEGIFVANEASTIYQESVKVVEFNLPYTRLFGFMSNTSAPSTHQSVVTLDSVSISGAAAYKNSNYHKVFRGSGVPQNISMMRSVTVKSPGAEGNQSLTITLGYLLSRYMFCEDTPHLKVHTSIFLDGGGQDDKVTRLSKMLVPLTLYSPEDRASIVMLSDIYNSKVTSGKLRLVQTSELTTISARATVLVYLSKTSQHRPTWARTKISARPLQKLSVKQPYVKADYDLVKSFFHLTSDRFKETLSVQEYVNAKTFVLHDRSRARNNMFWSPSYSRSLAASVSPGTLYVVGNAQVCPYVSYLALPRTISNTPHVVPYCRHFGCGNCIPMDELEKSYSNSQALEKVIVGELDVLRLSGDRWGGISAGVVSAIANQCIEGNKYVYKIIVDKFKPKLKQARSRRGR